MNERIESVLARPLSRAPAEVIKLENIEKQDAAAIYQELTEYVVTEPIRRSYRKLLDAMATAPSDPPEDIGVWVSGFFGSGKSSFAKNLGYALADVPVGEHHAGELLMQQVDDAPTRDRLTLLHQRVPTTVVMFDVNLDRSDAGTARPLSISHYLYRNLLRHLGYSDNLQVAELEHLLEQRNELDHFRAHFEQTVRSAWERDPERYREALAESYWRWDFRRDKSDALALSSARMHELFPRDYGSPDALLKSWAKVEVTPRFLVERSFAMMARRRPGHALTFVVDEVGGYVARNLDRIEDLRVLIEQYGKEGRLRLKEGKIPGPTWVVVTSQEKLGAVVDFLDGKRTELARLEDRFPQRLRVDLEPSDIQEVVSRRVLAKTDAGAAALRAMFTAQGPELCERLRLQGTHRDSGLDADRFARFYPYPPHFLGMCIEIVSNLRQTDRAGHNATAGGSNRTLIRQAYATLTSTTLDGGPAMKDLPVGRLVTLDRVCDMVWSNLSSEQKIEIDAVGQRFPGHPWAVRVAKALCMLQRLRDLPRREDNVAAVLWDGLGCPSALDAVRAALQLLEEADFVRLSADGWTLQNSAEKSWSEKRRAIAPRANERTEALRTAVKDLFEKPELATVQCGALRPLKLGLTLDEHELTSGGQLPLYLVTAPTAAAMEGVDGVLARTWTRSQEHASQSKAFWVWAPTPRVDELLTRLLQSDLLVRQEGHRAHGSNDHALLALIEEEKRQSDRLRDELQSALRDALALGVGVFRSVRYPAAELGVGLAAVLTVYFDRVVPDLYPHLGLGTRTIKGTEAEELLKSAALTGLPELFYASPKGLDLVVQKDQRWVVNADAPVARLVLSSLREKHGYGTKVTGKLLEAEFGGLGYGWPVELVQVVLAALLRAGHVEVLHQGMRFQAALSGDPRVRPVFGTKPAFRAASFAPRTTPGTKVLVKAASQYERLRGEEVDIEEGAIATAFQGRVVAAERDRIAPALAVAQALGLTLAAELSEQEAWWRNVAVAPSDDVVKLLAEEGDSLVERRRRLDKLVDALRPERTALLQRARLALSTLVEAVRLRVPDGPVEAPAKALQAMIDGGQWMDEPQRMADLTSTIERHHEALRAELQAVVERRREEALSSLQALPGWDALPPPRQSVLLAELRGPRGETLSALEAEAHGLDKRLGALQAEVLHAVSPERRTVRVKAVSAPVTLDDAEAVEEFVARLRRRLLEAMGAASDTTVLLE
jgi:hypothetical protein